MWIKQFNYWAAYNTMMKGFPVLSGFNNSEMWKMSQGHFEKTRHPLCNQSPFGGEVSDGPS